MSEETCTVMLSPDQIIRAMSDYCGARGLVPFVGNCRVEMETATVDGKVDHIRLRYTKTDGAK